MRLESYYLLRDGKIYYYRIRIPRQMQHIYTKKQLKRSLRTKNKQLALGLACKLHEYIVILLRKAEENMLDESQIDALTNEYVNILLQKHEKGLALQGLDPELPWAEKDVVNMQEHYKHYINQLKQHLKLNDLCIANSF